MPRQSRQQARYVGACVLLSVEGSKEVTHRGARQSQEEADAARIDVATLRKRVDELRKTNTELEAEK